MTHPTDRDEDYQRRTDAIKAVLLRNWPTMCDDGYDLGAVAHDLLLAVTPLPAAPAPAPIATPADDAVARATERVVNAWRRMDAHGSDAELRRAVDALYEAWTDAAERAASDRKGGDRG